MNFKIMIAGFSAIVGVFGAIMIMPQAEAKEEKEKFEYVPVKLSANNLTGVQARNLSDWRFAMGGETSIFLEESTSPYEVNSNLNLELRQIKKLTQPWGNLGDSLPSSILFPITKF
ncbi:MAG: hypothetical protein F6K10_16870 [Moorea sp. SIO2B7]|nr:hypothetical protein [Moorena sp. SIO2B7]